MDITTALTTAFVVVGMLLMTVLAVAPVVFDLLEERAERPAKAPAPARTPRPRATPRFA